MNGTRRADLISQEGLLSSSTRVLMKPFSSADLLATVELALGRSSTPSF